MHWNLNLCKFRHAQICIYYDEVAWLPLSCVINHSDNFTANRVKYRIIQDAFAYRFNGEGTKVFVAIMNRNLKLNNQERAAVRVLNIIKCSKIMCFNAYKPDC
jgi:hypothetical protein